MINVAYFLFFCLAVYAGLLMYLIRLAYDWQINNPKTPMPWYICGIAGLVMDCKGYKEDAGWGVSVFGKMYRAMCGDNWCDSSSYMDFYKQAFVTPALERLRNGDKEEDQEESHYHGNSAP